MCRHNIYIEAFDVNIISSDRKSIHCRPIGIRLNIERDEFIKIV